MRTILLATAMTCGVIGAADSSGAGAELGNDPIPPGGVNAPGPGMPPEQVVEIEALPIPGGHVRIPVGSWQGNASGYAVPGPLVAFRLTGEETWRGHSYVESPMAVIAFNSEPVTREGGNWKQALTYTFSDGTTWSVDLAGGDDGLIIGERIAGITVQASWVFDTFYHWQPTAGFVIDREVVDHQFLYLPGHEDEQNAAISHGQLSESTTGDDAIAALAVAGREDDGSVRVAGFWARSLDDWKNGRRLGVALWQRRQLPGLFSSRHSLGPLVKSDGTPSPHAAATLGESAYEGHVTMEFSLADGQRLLGFTCYNVEPGASIAVTFKQHMGENR